MNIRTGRQTKTVTVKEPKLYREAIGKKPAHHFDQNAEPTESYRATGDDPFQGGDRTVWATQAEQLSDGSPSFTTRTEEIDLTPRSPWKYGGFSGLGGAAAGGLAGLALSSAVSLAPGVGALIGAAAVGGVAGAVGAYAVHGEKTKLVWDKHDVFHHKMEGVHELVGPGRKNDEQGFFHRYIPEVKSTKIGSYETPRVVRYKGEDAETPKLAEESKSWPQVSTAKASEVPNRSLDIPVTYEDSVLKSRYLGSMPSDYHSYSSWGEGYTSCGPSGCNAGSQSVYRSTPVYEPDSEPRVQTVTEQVTAKAYSVGLFATGGTVGGGAVGAGLGYLASALTGLPAAVTVGVGAAVGGALGGTLAGKKAAKDRVKLEFREFAIHEKKMVGYRETVSPHYETECRTVTDSDGESHQECETVQRGWDHEFTADVRRWEVGSYVGPKVVHYDAEGQVDESEKAA